MTTPIINYTELRFTSETEMNRYLDQVEAIWTEEVMAVLQQNGMQRKSVTRIWNQTEQFKLGIVWEYESPQAFKKCQRIISEQILPHTHRFGMLATSFRGVPVLDWRGEVGGLPRRQAPGRGRRRHRCRSLPTCDRLTARPASKTPAQLHVDFQHAVFLRCPRLAQDDR